jgi:hypothetical protein
VRTSAITDASVLRAAVWWGYGHGRPERSVDDLIGASVALVGPMYRRLPAATQRAWCWGVERGAAMRAEGWWMNDRGEWCC